MLLHVSKLPPGMPLQLATRIDVKEDGCWIWTGGLNPAGQGRYLDRIKNKHMTLHRVMWEMTKFPLEKGQILYHKCPNPACCNPDHLTLRKIDRAARDLTRSLGHVKGSKHHNAKLTEEDVRLIRLALGRGVSQVQIAKQFKVTQATISNIKSEETWKRYQWNGK